MSKKSVGLILGIAAVAVGAYLYWNYKNQQSANAGLVELNKTLDIPVPAGSQIFPGTDMPYVQTPYVALNSSPAQEFLIPSAEYNLITKSGDVFASNLSGQNLQDLMGGKVVQSGASVLKTESFNLNAPGGGSYNEVVKVSPSLRNSSGLTALDKGIIENFAAKGKTPPASYGYSPAQIKSVTGKRK